MQSLIEEKLTRNIPKEVFDIFKAFEKEGKEIYLVGGAVRDLLLKGGFSEADFTTNATPEEIQKIFPDSFYDNVFGTVGLLVQTKEGEQKFEITTYRSEKGYSDKRRPDKVTWGKSLDEDLKRRDFTVNAMALRQTRGKLELTDLFEGQEDLKNKIIRAVGDPNERFSEDALRMLRAIRFSSQLGFTIEKDTFSAIGDNSELLDYISGERIRDELLKILSSDFSVEGITLLRTSGLLKQVLPELERGYGLSQAKHHVYDVWTHSLLSLKFTPSKDPVVRLASLIHDIGKPYTAKGEGEERTFHNHEVVGARIAENISERLKLSKKDSSRLVILVRWHLFTVDERQTDSAIRRFIRNVGKENLEDILALRTGDRLGGGARETSWRLEKFKDRLLEVQRQPFSVTDLKVNGKEVMMILGINPGPKVGEILNQLFDEVIEKKTENKKEILLKRLKEIKL
jgi:putative nucleotidyltransferase with HDIG domain